MPKIASQHAKDPWRPLKDWPDDCSVQWGGSGIVIGETGSYGTAFFEAFPGDGASSFIRGEGKDVEAAEAQAFSAYERQRDCFRDGGHVWTRARRCAGFQARLRKGHRIPKVSTYGNGGAFCLRCGGFQTAFKELHDFGEWRKPLGLHDLQSVMWGELRTDPRLLARYHEKDRARLLKRTRSLELRARLAGIAVPDHEQPQYRRAEGAGLFEEDAYVEACKRVVILYYIEHRDGLPGKDGKSLDGLFDGITRRQLDREADAYLATA